MKFRRIVWNSLKKMLFRRDAEAVHLSAVRALRAYWRRVAPAIGYGPLHIVSGSAPEVRPSPVRVWGMEFISKVGLAAGFDKNAEIVPVLPHLGFGFAEIGTVTPVAQPGNDKPRLFRDPDRSAIFNRMGFNGLGAERVARNLSEARSLLPEHFRVGVNLGKNKITPLEAAPSDYAKAAVPFEGLADYLVINVSSPNTPGLRQLQTEEALRPIVGSVLEVTKQWRQSPPVLLKLAPELSGEVLSAIIRGGETWGVGGWILTNTLAGERGGVAGGWSGGPLTEISRARVREVRALTRLPLISVGGIMDPEEALLRIQSGADLVQIYSGWIYRGVTLASEISSKIG